MDHDDTAELTADLAELLSPTVKTSVDVDRLAASIVDLVSEHAASEAVDLRDAIGAARQALTGTDRSAEVRIAAGDAVLARAIDADTAVGL